MAKQTQILITGGAGFIGSHVAVELVEAGFGIVILDNFDNSSPDVPDRITKITGTEIPVIKGDVRNQMLVAQTLSLFDVSVVIHLAGKKAVGESVAEPLVYYDNNVGGSIALINAMRETGVAHLVFSSSATVYGGSEGGMLDEDSPVGPANPYGRTKLMIEEIITDAVAAQTLQSAISLRYFNPVGANASGLIGDNPNDVPDNLFPFIAQTAAGWRDVVKVFGDDYETPDGTGVRDYIHIVDLARGHVAAVNYLTRKDTGKQHLKLNLGTGTGCSVKEALAAFSKACGFDIPHEIVGRRPGDIAKCVANPKRAQDLLNWRASMSLERMCADHWAFQLGLAQTDDA